MRYSVVLASGARRAMGRLPEGVVAAMWEFMHGPLAEEPRKVGKPLVGPLAGLFSARRGEYRIVYAINEDTIVVNVVALRHRRDAYRT